MPRADRQTLSDDNARKYPHSRIKEPTSPHELKELLNTARIQREQLKREKQEAVTQIIHVKQELETYQLKANEWEKSATQNHQLYLDEQQKYQQALCLYNQEQAKTTELLTKYKEANAQQNYYLNLYTDEQQKYQQTLCLYNVEKAKTTELLTKYEEANAQQKQYLSLYNDVKEELKYERRSKASIKGWETRRKRDNERLKREIGEMTVMLHESLTRKDEAVNNLYIVAERMDRIQQLVDSVEEESTSNPIGLIQKFKRIWFAIQEILGE